MRSEQRSGAAEGSAPQLSIAVVDRADDLVAHVPAWEELASQALEPNPFYEPWMLLPAARAFAQKTNLCFVLIYKANPTNPKGAATLCGFFPLERSRHLHGIPVRALSLWQHPYCFLSLPLLHRVHARECLAVFFGWLESGADWGRCLVMPQLCGEGPFQQTLSREVAERGRDFAVMRSDCRALFKPRESSDAYLQSALSGEQRKKLRQRAKRLVAVGKVDCTTLESGGDYAGWADTFLQVEASGWKGKERTALSSNQADRQFFLQVTQEAFRRGRLHLTALTFDGKPIALQSCFLAAPGAFAFKTCFSEHYANYAPGILLQAELIRLFHNDPRIQWVDSCAEPKSFLESLWMDRKPMQSLVVATRSGVGDFLVSSLPLLRCLKRRFARRKVRGAGAETD